jgi:hypothetical protein
MDYVKMKAERQEKFDTQQAFQASQGAPAAVDPASLRQQYQALCVVCERLAMHRDRLRNIGDFLVGEEPQETTAGIGANRLSAGGMAGDIATAFENLGQLLLQIERQAERVERVSR